MDAARCIWNLILRKQFSESLVGKEGAFGFHYCGGNPVCFPKSGLQIVALFQAGDQTSDMGVSGADGICLSGSDGGNVSFFLSVKIVTAFFSQGNYHQIGSFFVQPTGRFLYMFHAACFFCLPAVQMENG